MVTQNRMLDEHEIEGLKIVLMGCKDYPMVAYPIAKLLLDERISNFGEVCDTIELEYDLVEDVTMGNQEKQDEINRSISETLIYGGMASEQAKRLEKAITEKIKGVEDEDESGEIKLYYPTAHLKGYDELQGATELYGDEYRPIIKALWYNIESLHIAKAKLRLGHIETDGRVNILNVIKSGKGKRALKKVIKTVTDETGYLCEEPTSLHPEQLVGKVLKPGKGKSEYRKIYGYLDAGFLVVDEARELLTSQEKADKESRRYVRLALDPYPYNVITKRGTEIPAEEALKYSPKCPITLFIQPFIFEDDKLVLDGDTRRFLIPYVNMSGLDRTDAYKWRVFDETSNFDDLNDFIDLNLELQRQKFEDFKFTKDAKVRFVELSLDLIRRGSNYSQKIMNFMDLIDFTIQEFLLKFSAIQAMQNKTNLIDVQHVELAYLDLFEILEHEYQFITDKIPGYMNYGENWQGALYKDQEALRWLHDQGATTEDKTNTSIGDYKELLMGIFKVKDRQASEIVKKHKLKGWIETKKTQTSSKIWLNFITQKEESSNMQKMHVAAHKIANCNECNINKDYYNYYYIIRKYYKHCNVTDCNMQFPQDGNVHDTSENIPVHTVNFLPVSSVANANSKTTITSNNNEKIMELVKNSLKYNVDSGITTTSLSQDLEVYGFSYNETLILRGKLLQDDYITYNDREDIIKPTAKLMGGGYYGN